MAEILDRSVAKFRNSMEGGINEEAAEGGGRDATSSSGPKSNYVNFDIAQTVIVSTRQAGREESIDPVTADDGEDDDGSRTPTGEVFEVWCLAETVFSTHCMLYY